MARFWARLEAMRHTVKKAEGKAKAEEMSRKVEAAGREAEAARGVKLEAEVAKLWKKKRDIVTVVGSSAWRPKLKH